MRAAGGETATIPGGRPERTGEPPPAGEPPGETHFPAPLCRPGGPADLPDVPIRPEGGKKPVRGSESKTGTSREGPEPRQGSPRAKHLLRAPVQAQRPRTAPERPQPPGGREKPVRGSGSETGVSLEGETPARPGASRPRPEHRPASRAGPGRARREQSHGQPGAMNPSSEDGNRGRDRRLPRPRPGAVRKERRRRAAPAGRPSGR